MIQNQSFLLSCFIEEKRKRKQASWYSLLHSKAGIDLTSLDCSTELKSCSLWLLPETASECTSPLIGVAGSVFERNRETFVLRFKTVYMHQNT